MQCGCDIVPAGTRKRDRRSFGDVVARGFALVRSVFVCPDRLCDCRSWALVVSRNHFLSAFCSRQHTGLACVQQVSSRIVASVWSSRQHNSTTRFDRGITAKLVVAKSPDYREAAMVSDSEFCGNAHIGGGDTGPTFHVLVLWTCLARHGTGSDRRFFLQN